MSFAALGKMIPKAIDWQLEQRRRMHERQVQQVRDLPQIMRGFR